MNQGISYPHHSRADHDASFDHQLRDHLRTAPWLMVSGVLHAVLFLVMAQFPWSVAKKPEREIALHATFPEELVDPIETVEPPKPEELKPIEQEVPIEDVIVSEDTVTEEIDDPEDIDQVPVDAPFTGKGINDVIGVGGNAGGHGGISGGRGTGRGGGTAGQKAVLFGLDWLKRHQDDRGYWSCADFSERCDSNLCDGGGDSTHDVGVTGLALLAFLGSGHTPSTGQYKQVVRKGLRYLMTQQDAETGCFGEPNSHTTFLYDHAIASLAVTEGYGLSRWPILKEPAQHAIQFIQATRNPYLAWRYEYPPNGQNDLSVTGWMVMALKSAEEFGLRVDKAALDGAAAFIDSMTDENSWRAGYLQKGGASAREPGADDRWPATKTEAMTAVAMLCRVFLGQDPDKEPALRGGADLLRKRLPLWSEAEGTIDYYYWYYGSYAMYQMGGKDWNVWQPKMLDAVIKTQRTDGDERGSWDPQFDPWGARGGRVYATAIMTLCLEVYYRYDRVLGAR